MPPTSHSKNPSTGSKASKPGAVIPKETQHVSALISSATSKSIIPASTQRALLLRNERGGTYGTGDVVRMSGREKLELIAEDEMEKARESRKRILIEASMKSSVRAPFNLDTCLKVAQSQMDANIDFINSIHKPESCNDAIIPEIQARCPPGRSQESLNDPAFVAEQFGICVHNRYMLTSAWIIIYQSLSLMQNMGLSDKTAFNQLKSNRKLRAIYLLTFDLLKKLVHIGQQRLRSIVSNTEHFHVYFKPCLDFCGQLEFDRTEIRRMYKSFLDSTIIELCLPGSKFTPQSLYACLNATELESQKELRRCPQIMWDAVGDLAEAVRLLDLMETPLLNSDGKIRFDVNSTAFLEFQQWDEAQAGSIRAATRNIESLSHLVHPLTNLQDSDTLGKVWSQISENYIKETGKDVDDVWQVKESRYRVPYYATGYSMNDASGKKSLILARGARNNMPSHAEKSKRKETSKVFPEDDGEESGYSSIPELIKFSNSEENSSTSSGSFDESGDESDEYDTEEEEELKKLQKEVMNLVSEDPGVFDHAEGNDKYAEDRKKNPFLNLLGNLKGRLFTSTSILRTDDIVPITRRPHSGGHAPTPTDLDVTTNGYVEEADDEEEDDEGAEPKLQPQKRKKKKKRKKTAATAPTDGIQQPVPMPMPSKDKKSVTSVDETSADSPRLPISAVQPPEHGSPATSKQATAKSKSASQPGKKQNQRSPAPSISLSTTADSVSNGKGTVTPVGISIYDSTISLPLPTEEKAQSGHSYVAKSADRQTKTKVKTRPEKNGQQEPQDEGEKPGTQPPSLFANYRKKQKEAPSKGSGEGLIANFKKRTKKFAQRLFGLNAQDKKGSLKWDHFVQIMRELGFEYVPCTAGSSVRFDPPGEGVRPLTIHKPHPDPTLHKEKLRVIRDRLRDYYSWTPEVLKKAMGDLTDSDSE